MEIRIRARSLCLATIAFLSIAGIGLSPRPAFGQLSLNNLIVTVSSPPDGAQVRGTVTMTANVTVVGMLTVSGVQFQVDGVNVGGEDTTAPYAVPWNTLTASNGSHSIRAIARDHLGVRYTSNAVQVTVDNSPPTVSINQAGGQRDPTNGAPVNFTVLFSEPVSGFGAADVTVSGTAAGTKNVAVSGGPATYNVAVSGMASDGTVVATIAAGVAVDAAGNGNTASVSSDNAVAFDLSRPSVTINQAAGQPDPAATSPISFTVVFSEPVTGFNASDVTISGTAGGTKTAVVSGGPAVYNVAISGMTNGTVIAALAAGVATDAAGNTSTASTSSDNTVTFDVDTTPPTVTINQASTQSDPTGNSPILFTVVFSEPVNGFSDADVTISGTAGGTKAAAVSGGSSSYTVAVSGMTSEGTVVATIAAGVATDAAGNLNTASTSTDNSVTFATAPPPVTRIEDNDPAVTYTDTGTPWILGYGGGYAWSGGTASLGAVTGQRATLVFNGTGVTWIGFRGPQTGIANVYLDGTLVATVDSYAPTESVQVSLYSTSGLQAGSHTLAIEPTRTKHESSADYYVIVDAFDVIGSGTPPPADTTAPSVAITSPQNGATVSGTIPIVASASDNIGVAGVQFFVDGVAAGTEDTTSPYSFGWDTTTASAGTHTLTAVARDAAGNTTTSASVSVSVTTMPAPATATRFENTDPAITFTDGTDPAAGPVRWWHGSRSRGWSGGTAAFNRAAGALATFTFNGTSISWVGFRAHWAGIARVYIDGVFVQEIDLFNPPDPTDRENGEKDQEIVFRAANLTPGTHTITVESTGRKHGAPGCSADPSAGGDPSTCASDNAVVVDAFDVEPAGPPTVVGTRFEQTAYTAGWSQESSTGARRWSGGTAATSAGGHRASFSFIGTRVSWVGLRGPQNGIAHVFLDGAFHATVDTHSATEIQAAVFTATGLAPGRHTLEIEATGLKNAAATNSLVVIDAFDVKSSFEETDRAVTFSGTWSKENADKAWSGTTLNTGAGTATYSATAGAQAQFNFTGTEVTWIGFRAPYAGVADVWLDGVLAASVDLYAPAEQVRAPVFTATNLSAGPHTLRIDVTGQKNAAAGGALVAVDAFEVTLPQSVPTIARVQETDPAVSYTATSSTDWLQETRSPLRSGETGRLAVPRQDSNFPSGDARVTFTFNGTGIRWIGDRGRNRGMARVILDGGDPIDIDTYAALQDEYQAAVFTVTELAPGNHTITIIVPGTSNPASQGPYIALDSFEIYK
jgi:hypothetical protein